MWWVAYSSVSFIHIIDFFHKQHETKLWICSFSITNTFLHSVVLLAGVLFARAKMSERSQTWKAVKVMILYRCSQEVLYEKYVKGVKMPSLILFQIYIVTCSSYLYPHVSLLCLIEFHIVCETFMNRIFSALCMALPFV